MFIQPEQIRAARAMLNWSQQDLADAAGVSKDTVKNYELGNNQPNTKTLTTIEAALMTAGIDFSADGGLRPMKERIRTLTGADGMRSLMDMVYQTCLNDKNGHIIVANVNQNMYTKWLGDYAQLHRERMTQLNIAQPLRFLINQEHAAIAARFNYVDYRIIDDRFFGDIGLYCFKSYVALVNFANNACNITLIDNQTLNHTLTKILTLVWETSEKFEAKR